MKTLFVIWCICTVILSISIIGLVVVLRSNNTGYRLSEIETRSSWMQLGFELKNNIK
jgi:hypothetical protein